MARIILEIASRNGLHFVPVDGPLVRVGRAFDNDVILTDPTVSAHHFLIKRDTQGVFWLHPLSDENGTYVDRTAVDAPVAIPDEGLAIDVGRTRIRALTDETPVAPTRLINCRAGRTCLFESSRWAWVIFAVFVAVSLLDNYLSTPEDLSWDSFGRHQALIVAVILAISGVLAMLVRLVAHRWEPAGAVTFVSLMTLLATLLDQVADFGDYFLATSTIGLGADIAWTFLIAPVALYWFLVHVNHGSTVSSILLTLVLVIPGAYFVSNDWITNYGLFDTFSKQVYYSNELHPLDIRRGPTLTLQEYIAEMRELGAND
jgi:hypothetical protein